MDTAIRESRQAGSCSICNRYSTSTGVANHLVMEVTGKGLVVRFCLYCAKKLRKRLKNFNHQNLPNIIGQQMKEQSK
jgi:hypothetical protein